MPTGVLFREALPASTIADGLVLKKEPVTVEPSRTELVYLTYLNKRSGRWAKSKCRKDIHGAMVAV